MFFLFNFHTYIFDNSVALQKFLSFPSLKWLPYLSLNFQTTFVKYFMKKLPSFEIYFGRTDRFTNIYDLKFPDNETTDVLILFWNLHGRAVCYILSNKGNIKASILLKLLKCIVVGYSNGNESFTSRLFSSYGSLNMLFHFSRYLIYSVFHETFVKMFMTKLSFSSSKFKNPFQDVVSYRRLGCLILWYWNVGPLNTEMFVSFWGCFFRNKRADILNFSWIKYLSN